MAMFSQSSGKRQKVTKEPIRATDFFSGINKVEYKGENAPYDDTLCYRYYNAAERIHGRTMEEWIKPAISLAPLKNYGIDSHGKYLFEQSNDGNGVEDYKRFVAAAFEFCAKLGIRRWVAYDKDLVPDNNNDNVEEHQMFLNDMCETINELQQRFSLKALWIAPNFASSQRAGICSDANSMTHTGYQLKKCIELCQKVASDGFAIANVERGFNDSALIDGNKEIKYMARLLKMATDYKERLGYRGQFLLNAMQKYEDENANRNGFCARENKYFFKDPIDGLCFLKHYNLDRFYKLVSDPKYYRLCAEYNASGSVEICFDEMMPLKCSTTLMKNIIDQGGLQLGGINIQPRAKYFNEAKEMFVAYIKQIDSLAKGLRIAARITTDQMLTKNLQQQYATFYSGFGSRLSNGEANLEECEEQMRKHTNRGTDSTAPFRREHWDVIFDNYINAKISN